MALNSYLTGSGSSEHNYLTGRRFAYWLRSTSRMYILCAVTPLYIVPLSSSDSTNLPTMIMQGTPFCISCAPSVLSKFPSRTCFGIAICGLVQNKPRLSFEYNRFLLSFCSVPHHFRFSCVSSTNPSHCRVSHQWLIIIQVLRAAIHQHAETTVFSYDLVRW